ncbi:MAG TPA: MarR family transcriptional regulator [Gemmataceae bacterium]|nr:MarR family transcriptional regulator [Gemmataceae bacterium]
MQPPCLPHGDPAPSGGLAFLLSQVGAHAAARFAERLAPMQVAPAHAGILRVLRQGDGLSQQALGKKLRVFPSRLVELLDRLEERGLVERRASPTDRRRHALYLTEKGRKMLQQISRVAGEHENALCAALTAPERARMGALLRRIADEQGLTPGVHPGYRTLGSQQPKSRDRS